MMLGRRAGPGLGLLMAFGTGGGAVFGAIPDIDRAIRRSGGFTGDCPGR